MSTDMSFCLWKAALWSERDNAAAGNLGKAGSKENQVNSELILIEAQNDVKDAFQEKWKRWHQLPKNRLIIITR